MRLTVNFYLSLTACLVFVCSSVCAQTVSVAGGTFIMGNSDGEADERPEHTVAVSDFKMDSHEVTEAQYDSCVKSGRCSPAHYSDGRCSVWSNGSFRNVYVPSDRRDPALPVVCVTWFQARSYCQAYGKDLPTEAQWEYAALGGKRVKFSWGDQAPSDAYCVSASDMKPGKVCSRAANAAGLFDMTGNVWEWTGDFYSQDYYSYSESHDPKGASVGLYRVIRGGGWYSSALHLRVSDRNWFSPDFPEVSLGFRCSGK